ncbi:hypothetical protein ACHAXR_009852 [Thalassiosira sp. AJA248-18]
MQLFTTAHLFFLCSCLFMSIFFSQKCAAIETMFAVTAFILMWMGSIRCNFIKFTAISGASEPISLEFGIWYYQFWSIVTSVDGKYIFETCHGYPDSMPIDSNWKAARAFSVMTFIFALVVFITSIISACAPNSDKLSTRGWMAPAYLLTSFCQGLTLLILSSNACKDNILVQRETVGNIDWPDTCSLAMGANLCISATVLWFAAGLASYAAHKAEKEEANEEVDAGLREPLTA